MLSDQHSAGLSLFPQEDSVQKLIELIGCVVGSAVLACLAIDYLPEREWYAIGCLIFMACAYALLSLHRLEDVQKILRAHWW
jgi:hypothetical protein